MQRRRYSSLVSILRHRMESCDLRNPDPNQLFDYLCNKYPEYSRSKRRWLSKQVRTFLLESSCRKCTSTGSSVSDLDCGEEEYDGPKRKKAKKSDTDEEEKSQQLEDGMSTSGDGIYPQEYERVFVDLLNSQLREIYATSVKTGKDENAVVETELMEKDAELLNNGDGRERGARPGMVKRPTFKDLGGIRDVVDRLKRKMLLPLYHPEFAQCLGTKPPTGILLHGPPGCGKTKLAQAIANDTGVPFYMTSATELVSEEIIRELFAKAYRTAPSIIFIDEIDVIGSKRENLQRETDRRIVTQLMISMDESHRPVEPETGLEKSDSRPGFVLVIGATNRPDAVDPDLRRPGRFSREIFLGVPDESARAEILSVATRHLKVEGTFDLQKIARATPGFVGADLTEVADIAAYRTMERTVDHRERINGTQAEDWAKSPLSREEMEQARVSMEDVENACGEVQPSSKREGFSAIPSEKWEDVGGLQELRQVFKREIIWRIKFPELYEAYGINIDTAFLLWGPPGCGKTLIAKAIANEAGANFIHIKGPEILNKYVGESELAMRTIFRRARTCAPCILFFDEVDGLTSQRGNEGGYVVKGLVTQLLVELSEKRRGVYVIGATNKPEDMDGALLRPERFGKRLYVPLPSADERGLILTTLAKKYPIDPGVDLMAIGRDAACKKFSGADLSALMHEASMAAVDENIESEDGKGEYIIKGRHFKRALSKITPSVTRQQRRYFRRLSERF